MMGNRRNLIFRASIVINIAVLLYAALHLSGTNPPGDWIPATVDGSERSAEMRSTYRGDDAKNESDTKLAETIMMRNFEESTSQKTPVPSTTLSSNKTAASTASVADYGKNIRSVPFDSDIVRILDSVKDENTLTDATLAQLEIMLGCRDRDYLPKIMQRGEFFVLQNFVRADHGMIKCHETITYTTHSGFEYLDNLLPLVERWMSPVSLAIHAPGTDLASTLDSIMYLRDCSGSPLIRQFVTFHIFFPNKHMPKEVPSSEAFLAKRYKCSLPPPYQVNNSATYMKSKNLLYPVNVARNIARDAALTHFILPSDIELYPSPLLIPKFLNMIARNGKPLSISRKPRVFPISIFEVEAKANVPSTKTELQAMLANKTAIPFHKYVCPTCHNIPQGQQWIKAKETKQMDVFHIGKRQGKYVHWEPIFIGTHQDPYYDERLSWDGKKDKMPQGYILCVKDYDFMILNNAFLIHKPGIKRYVKVPRRESIASRQGAFVSKIVYPQMKTLFGTKNGCSM